MRIGLVCSTFLPSTGGIEWKVHYLATEYAKRGHTPVVFAGRTRFTLGSIALGVEADYEVVRSGLPLPRIDRLGILGRLYRRAILRRHRLEAFDVLHCHHLGMPTRFGVLVKHATGLPVVATTSGGDVMLLPEADHGDRRRPWVDRLVRENVRQVDVVGSINAEIHRELERLGTTARIVDVPNGVPWELFQEGDRRSLHRLAGLDRSPLVLLSVGRHRPVKGYELGLRAFAQVASRLPDAVYVLVGRDMSGLATLAASLGVAERVRLVERRPLAEMPSIFRSADVFFSPSLMEGFSQVNVQAMASGLACVITDAPGNADAAAAGGALTPRAGDVDSMAQALATVLGDAALRQELGARAHAASRAFAWSSIAERYLEIFAELAPRGA